MQIYYVFDTKLKDTIDKALSEVSDLRIPFGLIAMNWYKSNRYVFVGSPGKFKDLSPAYKKSKSAWKKSKGLGSSPYPVLVRTGRLRDSLLSPTDKDAIYRIGKDFLEMGTKVPYAGIHMTGSSKINLPARPFMIAGAEQTTEQRVNDVTIQNWIKIIENYMEQKIGNV